MLGCSTDDEGIRYLVGKPLSQVQCVSQIVDGRVVMDDVRVPVVIRLQFGQHEIEDDPLPVLRLDVRIIDRAVADLVLLLMQAEALSRTLQAGVRQQRRERLAELYVL